MTNSLKIIASLGCLLAGCDNTSVNPIQLAPRSTGLGGATEAAGGATTTKSTTGPAAGGVSLPKGGSGTGGASSSSSTGGSSSTGTGGALSSCLIIPNADTGWVDGTKNDCKIQGAWFSYNDCDTSPPPNCTYDLQPPPKSGFPNTDGVMCTSGNTVPIGTDYNIKWGAGIALNLNQQPSSTEKNPIGALPSAKPIKGFSFSLSGALVPELHVNFPTAATTKGAHFRTISAAGDFQVLFSEAQQPSWVTEAEKVDLVPGDVVSIEFQVVGKESVAVAFDFCVQKLSALY